MKKIRLLLLTAVFSILFVNAQRTPKTVCYVETNSHNIENVGQYKLADGTNAFDIAIIFAGNINVDANRRPIFHLNTGVQQNLPRARNLQNQGIQVLLSVLGNHTGKGISNFDSYAEAYDFAQQCANVVNQYGLDGIDIDDEFAGYGNNGFSQPNSSSFLFYVYALRQLLPNKLITFYNIGPARDRWVWTRPSDGARFDAANYVNYAWNPFYGTYNGPDQLNLPQMPRNRLGAAATWINNTSQDIATNNANRTRNDGYGIYVCYDLQNGDQSNFVSAVTEPLYFSRAFFGNQTVSCHDPAAFVASKTSTSINVGWHDANANSYYIWVRPNGGSWYLASNNITSLSRNITGLSPSTKYEIHVYSSCPNGSTPRSDLTVTTSASGGGNTGGNTGGGNNSSNIAQGKPFAASSYWSAGYEGWRSNDGNRNSRWASSAIGTNEPHWVYYDLQAFYNITSVKLYFESAISRDFNIQVWNGSAWINQTGVTNNNNLSPGLGLNTTARYIRFISWRHQYNHVSVWEFEVFGSYAYAAKKGINKEGTPPEFGDISIVPDPNNTIAQEKDLKVYPNPATGEFNIALKGFKKADITISDLLGKIVYTTSTSNNELQLSKGNIFKSGMYIIKAVDENNEQKITKLIIK